MLLYHYCSLEAFLCIVREGKLWLSNAHNMSDYLEGSWVVGIINDAFSELAPKYNPNAISKVVDLYNSSKFSPYVCCFSENGDLLSQWRGYASDGCGFAIGFDSDLFPRERGVPRMANLGDKDKEKLYLSKMDYDIERQKRYVKSLLELLLRHVEEGDDVNVDLVYEQSQYLAKVSQEVGFDELFSYSCGTMYDAITWLVGYAVIAKNPAFREEIEYRLIHAPRVAASTVNNKSIESLFELSEPKYRASGNKICSYYEFDFSEYIKDGIIQEVILGPKNGTSDSDLRALFGRMEKSDIRIKRSTASYR